MITILRSFQSLFPYSVPYLFLLIPGSTLLHLISFTSIFNIITSISHSFQFFMVGKNKKVAEKALDAPKKKVGPKGNFLGLCLEYLKSVLPTYLSHHADGDETAYISTILASYYAKFNWWELNTKVDPASQVDLDHIANSSHVSDEDGSLTEEEKAQKGCNMEIINKVSFFVQFKDPQLSDCSASKAGSSISVTEYPLPPSVLMFGIHGSNA